MLTRDAMHGLYSLPPTPFDARGNSWETAYREKVRTLIELGVDAVFSPGSNGEWWTLDDETRRGQMEVLQQEATARS